MWKIRLISTCLISYTSPILLLHNYYWKKYKLSSAAGNKKVEAAFFFSNRSNKQKSALRKAPPHRSHSTAAAIQWKLWPKYILWLWNQWTALLALFHVMFPQLKDCASLSFWEIRIQKHAVKWKVLKMWMASEKRAICLSLSATQMNNWTPGSYDFRWPDKLRNAEMKTSYGISNGKHFYEAWMKNWFCEEWFISHIWTFFDHLIVWAINWQFKLLLL